MTVLFIFFYIPILQYDSTLIGPFGKWQLLKSVVYAFYNCLNIYLDSPCQIASVRTEVLCWSFILPAVFCSRGQRKAQSILHESSYKEFREWPTHNGDVFLILHSDLLQWWATMSCLFPKYSLCLNGWERDTGQSSAVFLASTCSAAHFAKPWVKSGLR